MFYSILFLFLETTTNSSQVLFMEHPNFYNLKITQRTSTTLYKSAPTLRTKKLLICRMFHFDHNIFSNMVFLRFVVDHPVVCTLSSLCC